MTAEEPRCARCGLTRGLHPITVHDLPAAVVTCPIFIPPKGVEHD